MNNCINIIKITILKNKKGFIIPNNNKNINVIKSFLKINILTSAQFKDDKILVYVNYINNKPVFKNIINMFKTSNKKYINLKELKKLNEKHNWILILSTNKGILNSIEAANLNVGGLIIAIIWN